MDQTVDNQMIRHHFFLVLPIKRVSNYSKEVSKSSEEDEISITIQSDTTNHILEVNEQERKR